MHLAVPIVASDRLPTAQGQWNPATSTYLFPVRALSRHVRGGFVSRLRQAIAEVSLSAEELLCRFLLHVLPKGFMRIRHFGFLANACRRRRLRQIRAAIKAKEGETTDLARTEDA